MKKVLPPVPIVVACVGIVVFSVGSISEGKETGLLAEASRLVQAAQEAEATSYAEALKLYEKAAAELERIISDHASSELAGKIQNGEAKVGPYTVTELEEAILPLAKLKAEAEESPLACAFLLATTVEEPQQAVRTLESIAEKYKEAGREDKARETLRYALTVAREEEDHEQRARLLSDLGNELKDVRALEDAVLDARIEGATDLVTNIAVKFHELGHSERALKLLDETLQGAREAEDADRKDAAFSSIAGGYVEIGQCERAAEIAKALDDPFDKARILIWAAEKYSETGQRARASEVLEKALHAAEKMGDSFLMTYTAGEIAGLFVRVGESDQACRALELITDPGQRAKAIADLAALHAEDGQNEKALETLSEAVHLADTISDSAERFGALSDIIETYSEIEQLPKASGVLSKALETAKRIEDADSRHLALSDVAGYLAELGRYDEALRIADAIEDPYRKSEALTSIADAYAESGERERAIKIFSQALEAAKRIDSAWQKAMQFAWIMGGLYELQDYATTMSAAQMLEEPFLRATSFAYQASHYLKVGETQKGSELAAEALRIAQSIDDQHKAGALRLMAAAYARNQQCARALETARAIELPDDKARTLAQIDGNFENGPIKIGPPEKKILREIIRDMQNETK